jgi:hypothetical protein
MQPKAMVASMAYWLDWLRYRFWGSGLGLLILLFLALTLAIAFFFQRDVARKAEKGLPVVATITELRIGVSKYRPGLMAGVVAQDEKGTIGRESVETIFVAGCEVGDQINAKRAGTELILEPMPCR